MPTAHHDGAVPPVLTWLRFAGRPLTAAVTSRTGGVSGGAYTSLNLGLHVGDDPDAVVENRRRAAAAVGLGLDDLVFARQVHGREVAVVDRSHRGRGTRSDGDAVDGVDALVTTEPGVGLVVLVADCVPLVLCDPTVGVVACVHAGWRGAVARVAAAAVEAMVDLGAERSRVEAGIGPAVAARDYQVGADVHDAVTDAFGAGADELITPDGTGRFTLDLPRANRRVLVDAGVGGERIETMAVHTGDGGPFFSDRAVRPCGRFGLIAALGPVSP